MAILSYTQWTQVGSPWSAATCITDFAKTLRGHGYTVYILGDVANHLKANTPEDHCPYSHTPWPGSQPYPRILACDVMPGGSLDWRTLGERLVADKNAHRAGTEWIKYINYTDRAGKCWNASWQPTYSRRPSTDKGHIHISARTDYVNAHTSYDPTVAAPAAAPVTTRAQEDRVYHEPVPLGPTGKLELVFPFGPDDNPGMSIATDTGVSGQTKAQWRVAKHKATNWSVVTLSTDAGDHRRLDVVLEKGTDRVTIARAPVDDADKCDVIASVLGWW